MFSFWAVLMTVGAAWTAVLAIFWNVFQKLCSSSSDAPGRSDQPQRAEILPRLFRPIFRSADQSFAYGFTCYPARDSAEQRAEETLEID
jgi:hypothetical protein